jgi:regulator of ribonuclease activity A
MLLATTDLSDAHSDVQIAEPLFRDFGGERAFFGPIATLKLFEDNALVREALESPGEGRVLVVDGAGSLRCALVGGNLAALAEKNGWSGIVVFGAVRDTRELATAKVGVKALAPHPKKSIKKGAGERDVPVTFAGVTFRPGAWLYADEDGILVSERRLDG